MNKRKLSYLSALSLALTAVCLIWYARPTAANMSDNRAEQAGPINIFLPLITQMTSFEPPTHTTLPGGVYTFSSFVVTDNITVTVTGDVHITVQGNVDIAGTVIGDCVEIQLHGRQDVTVTGVIDNGCDNLDLLANDTPGDLTIYAYSDNLTVGSLETPAFLHTSGNLNLGNAPEIEDWEFDVLPDQRATAPMPPVCSAQADALWETVYPGSHIEVAFSGDGIDPNGGPVSYQWDFGDGSGATEQDPLHIYDSWGVYDVVLTVTDSGNLTCQAALRLTFDDGDENIPDSPAVWLKVIDLAVAVGEPADFAAAADYLGDNELSFVWDFGEPAAASIPINEPDPSHTYSQSGRYAISVTVTDDEGRTATAVGSVYVYEEPEPLLTPLALAQNCLFPPPGANLVNVQLNDGKAPVGKNGKHTRLSYRGNVYVLGGTNIKAQDGGDGKDESGSGTVRGGHAGRGGSLSISVRGRLTVCGGAVLAAGNGGRGGNAISDTPAPGHALAYGGKGGDAAKLLRLAATQGIHYDSPTGAPVIRRPGNGGPGGMARAEGGDGAADCAVGERGARASAYGGPGGKSSKQRIVRGWVTGLGNSLVQGGRGGDGGRAVALAGNGGEAVCPTMAEGGQGERAIAHGGKGGEAKYRPHPGAGVAAGAFKAGDGGDAEAYGGDGGRAVATPPGGVTAIGGAAGGAAAYGGQGAVGRTNGAGGNALAVGGAGGPATATGQVGDPCEDGGDATATGGRGGNAAARKGRAYGDAAAGTAVANAGSGGDGAAFGGRGGDCEICPNGGGGDGGQATATGGRGGNAGGNGVRNGGDGGAGNARGGDGGTGADCCGPPHLAGGNGGDGGVATSTAGGRGLPGGNWGGNGGQGGNGGDGGDGEGPGSGGPRGPGNGSPNDIPDGDPGADGEGCPDPPPPILPRPGRPNHGQIPNGLIIPGSQHDLDVLGEDGSEIIGIVPTRFMNQGELAPYGVPDAEYHKLEEHVFIGIGGVHYTLTLLPNDFAVMGVEFTIDAVDCPPGCVALLGFYQGELIVMVQNQGAPGAETLILPDPADIGSTAPHYDTLIILGYGPFLFDVLGVVLLGE